MCEQWTAERVTLLERLWESGASASAIAAELGGLSRSAVAGKIYRLRRATEPTAAPKPALQASRQIGKGLLELTNNSCRWPIGRRGKSEILFCGVPEADLARGMPYCPHHARRAYRIAPKIIANAEPKPAPADSTSAKASRAPRRRRYVWRAGVRHPAPRFR
jgi:GcrA cell cycle regulator